MLKELTSLRLVMSSRFIRERECSCLFLQTDEAEKLDKEAADKPAGKNSMTSVHDYNQEKQLSLELNSRGHFDLVTKGRSNAIIFLFPILIFASRF